MKNVKTTLEKLGMDRTRTELTLKSLKHHKYILDQLNNPVFKNMTYNSHCVINKTTHLVRNKLSPNIDQLFTKSPSSLLKNISDLQELKLYFYGELIKLIYLYTTDIKISENTLDNTHHRLKETWEVVKYIYENMAYKIDYTVLSDDYIEKFCILHRIEENTIKDIKNIINILKGLFALLNNDLDNVYQFITEGAYKTKNEYIKSLIEMCSDLSMWKVYNEECKTLYCVRMQDTGDPQYDFIFTNKSALDVWISNRGDNIDSIRCIDEIENKII